MPTDIFVVPDSGGWSVKRTGQNTPISTHRLKGEAVSVAQGIAKRDNVRCLVHGTDGVVEELLESDETDN